MSTSKYLIFGETSCGCGGFTIQKKFDKKEDALNYIKETIRKYRLDLDSFLLIHGKELELKEES